MRRVYGVDVVKKQFLGQIKRCLLSRYFNQMISEEKNLRLIVSIQEINRRHSCCVCPYNNVTINLMQKGFIMLDLNSLKKDF